MNRELLAEAGLEGKSLFFMRAGYTTSPRYTTLRWAGDQLTTWDRHDGIGSVLPGMLSGGISGLSLTHSDIGGYTSVRLLGRFTPVRRTRELFARWCELAAFTAAYRTHEGMWPPANAHHDTDGELLAHFGMFAAVHRAWAPLRRVLGAQASAKGHPLM